MRLRDALRRWWRYEETSIRWLMIIFGSVTLAALIALVIDALAAR